MKPVLNLPKLQDETAPDGVRHYVTPSGNRYPSITTVLSWDKKKTLDTWRKRVGEEQAGIKTRQGARRGSALHEAAEVFLSTGAYPDHRDNPLFYENFTKIVPFLKRVSNILILEAALYSDLLRLAGRCDLVALVDGIFCVIDFKTSGQSLRKYGKLESYFTQTCAYSMMLKETYHVDVPDMKIVCAVDFEPGFEEYNAKRIDYIDRLIDVKRRYDKELSCQ